MTGDPVRDALVRLQWAVAAATRASIVGDSRTTIHRAWQSVIAATAHCYDLGASIPRVTAAVTRGREAGARQPRRMISPAR